MLEFCLRNIIEIAKEILAILQKRLEHGKAILELPRNIYEIIKNILEHLENS